MKRSLRTATVATSALALALTLPLAGCGGDSSSGGSGTKKEAVAKEGPTGTAALEAAKKNLKELKSVTFSGTVKEDGSDMKIDGKGSVKKGEDYELTVDGTIKGVKQSLNILSVGGTVYMKGSEDFYKQNLGDSSGKMAAAIGDKYLQVPSEQTSSMSDMSLAGLMDSAFDPDDMDADDLANPSAKGKLVNFEGTQAYEYKAKDDDAGNFYLTADGSKQFAGLKSNEEGTIVFKDHNKKFTIEAPAKDQVMSMEDLQKAAMGG